MKCKNISTAGATPLQRAVWTLCGSMALLATTCGWSFAHINCPESGGNIVIQSGEIRYLKPALGDLTAVCTAQSPAPAVLERGASVVRTTGFTYNDATQQVQLLSKVKVTHVPTRH